MTPWKAAVLAALAVALANAGCGDKGSLAPNQPPETFITSSVPRDSSRVPHHVEFFYRGGDVDGSIAYYEYFLHTYARSVATIEQVALQEPAPNDPGWRRVGVPTLRLAVAADTLRADPRDDIGAGEFDRWHTFYVRAVDNEGAADPTPESRTFHAYTRAPVLGLQAPLVPGSAVTLPRTLLLRWDGIDPIGGLQDPQDPYEARWTLVAAQLDGGGRPIGFPDTLYDLPENAWSPWARWAAADSSGRRAVLRDLVARDAVQAYVFAVQGRDDGGAITPKFDAATPLANNYGVFVADAALPVGPRLTVRARQDTLYAWTFAGVGSPGFVVSVPYDTLTLYWSRPTARHYGANASDNRFGWNIEDVNDPLQWTAWGPVRVAPPFALQAGEQVFRIQCRDEIGQVTTGVLAFSRR